MKKVAFTLSFYCHLLFGVCVGVCYSSWELWKPTCHCFLFFFFNLCQLCCPKAPAFPGMQQLPPNSLVPPSGSCFDAAPSCLWNGVQKSVCVSSPFPISPHLKMIAGGKTTLIGKRTINISVIIYLVHKVVFRCWVIIACIMVIFIPHLPIQPKLLAMCSIW